MDSATSGLYSRDSGQQQRVATSQLTYKMLSKMPLNLRKKAIALVKGQATTIYVQRDGLDTLKVILHQSEPTLAQLKKAITELSLTQLKRKQQESHPEQQCSSGRRPHGKERQQDREQQQVDRNDGAIHSSTGELVHSGQRNGHDHRAFVSWRFLWRCFVLYNVDTNQPINDQANGRTKLHELGIKNAATLKFVHRIKYFGRRRQ
ncbi:uncharacterized protein [Drosophila tropicalis]|uniref:uncharacterized protein isoform X3 n=1 Tax=Drosophila tropicalis TaxID=46794 RepID=UPI0035AB9D50